MEILDLRLVKNKQKNITLLKYKPRFPRKQPRTWAYTDSLSLETAVRTHVPAQHFLIEYPIQSFYLFIQMQIKPTTAQMPSLRHKFNYNKAVAESLIWTLFYTYVFTF